MRLGTIVSAVALLVPFSAAASGPTLRVNSLADAPGSVNAQGACETAPGNGVCTLRAAVMEANFLQTGATIEIPAGTYALTIPDSGHEADGDLNVDHPATITGAGPSVTIIDGGGITTVFNTTGAGITMQGLTIRNGRAPSETGAGIYNTGTLTLENVVVSNNNPTRDGGGIYSAGTLTLRHCIVEGNTAQYGGGIANDGTALIEDSLIQGNQAQRGGGIGNGGDMTIERSSILQNETYASNSWGAGIYSNASAGSSLVMVDDQVSSNGSRGFGGGIYVESSTATLINLTVTTNVGNADHENEPVVASGGPFGGGIGIGQNAYVFLKNSVVAGNLSGAFGSLAYVDDECGGASAVTSGDYDLIGDPLQCDLSGQLDHVNVDPVDPALEPVASNGGFAPDSAALSASGPTVAAIPHDHCTDQLGAPLAVDFRGYDRRLACDIGADQFDGAYSPPTLLSVNLIRNGGAEGDELGEASTDETVDAPAPYWSGTQGVSQVVYGTLGFPFANDAPAKSGTYFFAGGNNNDVATSRQLVDVTPIAAQIDAGQVPYRASGAFGGYRFDDDNVKLLVTFRDVLGQGLSVVALGGFTAADRGNVTKLIPDTKQGIVPAGTRSIEALLYAARFAGTYNDGYADDLSLVLPEPAEDELAGVALAALAAIAIPFRRKRS
jgi:CSLREA domain-containing protein